ncbi:MAG: type II toxin-antitoxin system RelE/ParE family toxin [Anaerolinea sp.]|nr:type II toxin-antitoxin system RelE/ParE family toxin [Anaerolinea sp.]
MSYRVWIDPSAVFELKGTPGHVRQRLKRAMLALGNDPRPPDSKQLDWLSERFEPRRLKLRNWRVVYAVDDQANWVWVLAIRKRPPYDYDDLDILFQLVG